MKLKHKTCALMMLLIVALSPSMALAQAEDEDTGVGFGNIYYVITGISVAGITTAGVLVMLLTKGGVSTTSSSTQDDASPAVRTRQAALILDAYMSDHPNAWHEALALGAGAPVEDVSWVLGDLTQGASALGLKMRHERAALTVLEREPAGLARGYKAISLLGLQTY